MRALDEAASLKRPGVRARSRREPNRWLANPMLAVVAVTAAILPMGRVVLGNESLLQLLVADAILLVALLLGYVRRPPLLRIWLLGLLLLPLGAIVSGQSSSLRASAAVGVALAILCALAPAVLTRLMADAPHAPRVTVAAFIVGQTASSGAALLQVAGIAVGGSTIFGRATGLAGHPNTLGIMATLALVACLGAWRPAGGAARAMLLGAIAMNAAALVATGSLSAMLAAAVAATFGAVAARRVIVAVIGSVLAAAIMLVGSQFATGEGSPLASIARRIDVVTGASDGSGGAASLGVREATYEWAWRWIADSPFVGVGMDTLNAGTFNGVTVVHSFILRGWYQGGALVALWLTLLTAALLVCVVLPAARRSVAVWPAAAVLLIVVFAATSAFYTQLEYWLPLVFAITLAGRALQREDRGLRVDTRT